MASRRGYQVLKGTDLFTVPALGICAEDARLKLLLLQMTYPVEPKGSGRLREVIARALGINVNAKPQQPLSESAAGILTILDKFMCGVRERDTDLIEDVLRKTVLQAPGMPEKELKRLLRHGKRLKDPSIANELEAVKNMAPCETDGDFARLAGLKPVLAPPLDLLQRIIKAIRGNDANFFGRVLEIIRNAKSAGHPLAPADPLVQLLAIFFRQCGGHAENPKPPTFTFRNFRQFAAGPLGQNFPDYRHVRVVAKSLGIPFAKDRPGPRSA